MQQVFQFLTGCPSFYLATVEGDQPRVRPFGALCAFEDKLYICTSKKKNVFAQIQNNPNVEISATSATGEWVRITAKVVADPSREAKAAMLEANPNLKRVYTLDDDIFAVFYLKDATAVFRSFKGRNDTVTF